MLSGTKAQNRNVGALKQQSLHNEYIPKRDALVWLTQYTWDS